MYSVSSWDLGLGLVILIEGMQVVWGAGRDSK